MSKGVDNDKKSKKGCCARICPKCKKYLINISKDFTVCVMNYQMSLISCA